MNRKVLFIIIFVVLLFNLINASSLDYMQGVDLDKMNAIYEKILNYKREKEIKQNFLEMDNTCVFEDRTTINSVKVDENDEKRKNKIAITIDDNFNDKYTEDILEVLDKHNCKATFFITYKLMNLNPERIFDIISRGHEIGNHSMTHPPFNKLHTLRKEWEIDTFNLWFKKLTDNDVSLFRFPTGSYDGESIDMLKNKHMYPIGWSIDTSDWALKDADKICEKIASQNVKSGDIVLLHNGYKCSKEEFDKVLTYYENKGFSYLKVSEMLYNSDFTVKNGVQMKSVMLKKP